MPICKACREASEGAGPKGPVLPHCPTCGRHIQVIRHYRIGESPDRERERLRYHKKDGRVCSGTHAAPDYRPAWDGHDDCDGCPCQHRPRGSWNQKGTS